MTDSFYIHLRSDDSKEWYPTNQKSSFIVKLPRQLYFHGTWKCALCSINLPPVVQGEMKSAATTLTIDVCSPMCSDSITGSTDSPVLRRLILTEEDQRNGVAFDFNPLEYIPIVQRNMENMHIYLRYTPLEQVSLAEGTLYCTLHFRKDQRKL